jgi:catechol 2,3-dioxygenase-like lactoylglutathione lyase family enzyme
MIETKGVVHFTISVSDPDKSEAFYRDVLGLKVVQKVPSVGMVFMTSGNDHIILTKSKTPIDPNPGNEFLIHHAFRVDADKYDAAVDHLKSHGVEPFFEEDRREGIFIGRQCYFHDPDRNVLEIAGLEEIGEGYGVDGVPEDLNPFSKDTPA